MRFLEIVKGCLTNRSLPESKPGLTNQQEDLNNKVTEVVAATERINTISGKNKTKDKVFRAIDPDGCHPPFPMYFCLFSRVPPYLH